jgi:hypothetical protein
MTVYGGVSYGPEIAAAAARHGVDCRLLAAVAAQETGGPGSDSGRNVVGDGGHGHGLFQIDDRWHAFASSPAAEDPAANADYAATMLAGLLKRFGGDVRSALSAYNAGSPTARGTVTEWPDGSRLGYADSVLRHLSRLGGAVFGRPGPQDAPPLQFASQQPAPSPFRSFASEFQLAASACDDADRRMAALIDPTEV